MLDGRFLSDAMAPDDLFHNEVRGAVVSGMMPLMHESGYRISVVEILGLEYGIGGNQGAATRSFRTRILAATRDWDSSVLLK